MLQGVDGEGQPTPGEGGRHWRSSVSPARSADSQASDGSYDTGDELLGDALTGDALCRTLVDTHTANELGLVRSEVRRMRAKIQLLEREKAAMADDFRATTQILLNRIKELEAEVSESKSRPQTAAIIERIEGRPAVGKPPLPKGGEGRTTRTHTPEVLRIDEDEEFREAGQGVSSSTGARSPAHASTRSSAAVCPVARTAQGATADEVEGSICGNCGREIPGGNIISHSIHCYRNNYRCDGCNEVLPQRDREAHLAEWTDPRRLVDAMSKRDIGTVQRMVEHGADISTAVHPESKDTVLHAAARVGDAELIAFCMGYGVDVSPANSQGDTPLHCAVESGDFAALKFLVEVGAELNVANTRGDPPLMLACRLGIAEAARLLVEVRADAEACTVLGDTPIDVARGLGHQETVLALATAGAPLRSGTPSRARSGSPMPPLFGKAGYPAKQRSRQRNSTPNRVPPRAPVMATGSDRGGSR